MSNLRTQQMQSASESDFTKAALGKCGEILTVVSMIIAVVTFPFSIFFCLIIVPEYERVVIFRLGRLLEGQRKGPGLTFILPCIDRYYRVDTRTMAYNIPSQEVLIKESITLQVDAVIYYRIHNPTESIISVLDANYSTQLLAQTTLRNTLADRQWEEIIGQRLDIAQNMKDIINKTTEQWGVTVEKIELKDLRLPQQMQRTMTAEAEAIREAKAKVISADGEKKASEPLKEAAQTIAENPIGLQLRYLQTLSSITTDKTSTIILPLPVDLITKVMRKDLL
ncbi:band 7 protein AGAP004871 [Nephila pilipes]|uniref:Band 7 protein AGAP004871 n=1 Tax=Nephila pilipes TaxID=299642 RepID=A0A8X6UFG4_NEPPI|nr:band 7 protein AGAP004871 [Nephila pilipes]